MGITAVLVISTFLENEKEAKENFIPELIPKI